ncbi:uncharacterized protein LOC129194766 [Dunckerocampus dactyliophorus]|uniref:uncharacterized protein LOC129194766 n=1 Tax=Dunckerocampus dactyliophorus TaxID=161453 RepID=UPI0024058CF0|nr:uncharacterized protein LOC129194766 [Dunckerocampus dactyliophorus]
MTPSNSTKQTMSDDTSHRAAILPHCSNRTLQHPSFMPLYMAAKGSLYPFQTVPYLSPQEVFYNEPTHWGKRIPNTVANLESELSLFQLNTRPPLVSCCEAPPKQADPKQTDSSSNVSPLCGPTQAVIQLSWDEILAITCHLKLHHPMEVESTSTAEPSLACGDTRGLGEHSGSAAGEARGDAKEDGRWCDAELEAAHTLMGGFGLGDEGTAVVQRCLDGGTEEPQSCKPEWMEVMLTDAVEIYEEYLIPLSLPFPYLVDAE